MCWLTILLLTTFTVVTVSQPLIAASTLSVKVDDSVDLTCTVTDFTDNIFVKQGTTNRAVCFANSPCSSTNTSLYTVSKSGSTFVIFTILSFSKTRDEGQWSVRYGSTDSQPITLSVLVESDVTTEGSTEGSGDSDGKLGTGAIIGIFIGSLAGAVGIFFLIVCIWMCVVGRKRNKKTDVVGDEEAMDVCCCATCSCCVCCSTFLMSVTCNLFVNRKKTKIAPKDVEEFIYVKKNSNMEFGEHQSNARNAKWVKDGNEISTTHIKCTMFKIDKASVNHEGLYICISNDLKRKYYLIVVGRTEMVYVEEDQDVELGVKIPGIEHISGVKWKNDRHDVKQDNVVENKLQILNASLHDEGKYFCTFGTKKKLTYLLIIVGTEKTINVIEGNQIEFGKEIPDSDATSDAYWTKDGSRIESTSPKKTFYQINQADGNSKGLYVCHLGNKAELKYRLIKSE